jgi:hypothetical protein
MELSAPALSSYNSLSSVSFRIIGICSPSSFLIKSKCGERLSMGWEVLVLSIVGLPRTSYFLQFSRACHSPDNVALSASLHVFLRTVLSLLSIFIKIIDDQ